MKNVNSTKLLSAILTILVGMLFLIWKGAIVSIAMTVIGVLLIIAAVMNLIRKNYTACVIGAVFGVMVLCFGWIFLSVALYVLAAILLIYEGNKPLPVQVARLLALALIAVCWAHLMAGSYVPMLYAQF